MDSEAKQYELICILDPHSEGADLDHFKTEIEKLLANNNGRLVHAMEPQKRELAYPINKQTQGIYVVSHISLEPKDVVNFLKELKNNKQILRYLINVLEIAEPEKPRIPQKPKTKKETKEEPILKPVSAKATAGRNEKSKLEEIDKKLDELVGF